MANKWIVHVKKTMKQMKSKGTYAKGKGLGQVIKEAKKTWKKHSGGGTDPASTEPSTDSSTPTTTGGRRTRKNKPHGRK
jgi:hypothetical protein